MARSNQTKSVRLNYYASLRDARGVAEETLETGAQTPRELYRELRDCYDGLPDAEVLRVAVNDEVVDWDDPLSDGDSVVFLTPFGGGSCSP